LATISREQGRELGLQRGANVVMPNLTPSPYRESYEIYPGKASLTDDRLDFAASLRGRIESLGRHVGTGRGDARRAVGPASGSGA
jgi:biotin synthase